MFEIWDLNFDLWALRSEALDLMFGMWAGDLLLVTNMS